MVIFCDMIRITLKNFRFRLKRLRFPLKRVIWKEKFVTKEGQQMNLDEYCKYLSIGLPIVHKDGIPVDHEQNLKDTYKDMGREGLKLYLIGVQIAPQFKNEV